MMNLFIVAFCLSVALLIALFVIKKNSIDSRYPAYISLREKTDHLIRKGILLLRRQLLYIREGWAHFFKKSVPLFFAHVSSIIASYILRKASRVVDMVKGRHVFDHATAGSASVSSFLGQVAEYKTSDKPLENFKKEG